MEHIGSARPTPYGGVQMQADDSFPTYGILIFMKKYIVPLVLAFIGLNFLASSSFSIGKFLGFALLGWSGWMFLTSARAAGKDAKQDPMRERLAAFNYNHFYKGSGIGLDSTSREIHLISEEEYKVYPFSNIRNWETNIMTGGLTRSAPTLTTAIAASAENHRQQKENAANTGLFLQVRDVDHPKWHIKFPPKDLQRQLDRWMEILRQEVNEAV